MPTRNRGKHSNDDKIFCATWHETLKDATDDLCFLLTRGYAFSSALQIVGNRYKLNKRQRMAINRVSASEQEINTRTLSQLNSQGLKGQQAVIDGFNLLILIESALSGAYIFKSRDNTYRDISGVHSTYKQVLQTKIAIELIFKILQHLEVRSIMWYLDKPVSNSGRLKKLILDIGSTCGVENKVELVYSPDKLLRLSTDIVITSDGPVLNEVNKWFNLGAFLIENHLRDTKIVVL